VFATLLNPRAFAPSLEEQIALVSQLGGPFLSERVADLRAARAHGLSTGLILREGPGTSLAAQVIKALEESEAEIVAICTHALNVEIDQDGAPVAELRSALASAEGRHRMVITLGSTLAAQSASAWRSLPMESLLFDPIADPDGWRAAATLPGECGLVLALIAGNDVPPVAREALLWGLRYAASLGGRGGHRVGFTERPARGWMEGVQQNLPEESALTFKAMGDLLRLTLSDRETLERELDPRSISPAAQRLRGQDGRERR
jgi:hypothetical protein